jgi:hypothetical protein
VLDFGEISKELTEENTGEGKLIKKMVQKWQKKLTNGQYIKQTPDTVHNRHFI